MTKQNQDYPIPESAQRLIEVDQEEYNREYDRLDDMSIKTPKQIRDKLLQQGIGRTLMTAEDVEVEELSKIPIPVFPNGYMNKSRRYKRERDKKPLSPRQLNIADGDERVKSAYPKSD